MVSIIGSYTWALVGIPRVTQLPNYSTARLPVPARGSWRSLVMYVGRAKYTVIKGNYVVFSIALYKPAVSVVNYMYLGRGGLPLMGGPNRGPCRGLEGTIKVLFMWKSWAYTTIT